jgi:hypothetical protein
MTRYCHSERSEESLDAEVAALLLNDMLFFLLAGRTPYNSTYYTTNPISYIVHQSYCIVTVWLLNGNSTGSVPKTRIDKNIQKRTQSNIIEHKLTKTYTKREKATFLVQKRLFTAKRGLNGSRGLEDYKMGGRFGVLKG